MKKEWISVEDVHEAIYEENYPIRMFEKNKLANDMKNMDTR